MPFFKSEKEVAVFKTKYRMRACSEFEMAQLQIILKQKFQVVPVEGGKDQKTSCIYPVYLNLV